MQIKPQPHFPLPLSHHEGTSERGDTNCTALAVPTAPRVSPSGPSTWGHSSDKQILTSPPRSVLCVQQMLTDGVMWSVF